MKVIIIIVKKMPTFAHANRPDKSAIPALPKLVLKHLFRQLPLPCQIRKLNIPGAFAPSRRPEFIFCSHAIYAPPFLYLYNTLSRFLFPIFNVTK